MIAGAGTTKDVVILHWPEQADRIDELERLGIPRLLLVEPESAPPMSTSCIEDWLRMPVDDASLRARLVALAAHARRHPMVPSLDEHGQLSHRGETVFLSITDQRIAEVLVENFGDAPFVKDVAANVTIAAMTACAIAAREAAPHVALGINVLRNDVGAALAIAAATGATFVRVNVLSGARLTDQGVIEGRAAEVMRLRAAIAPGVRVFADVDVKHSAPLAPRLLVSETLRSTQP